MQSRVIVTKKMAKTKEIKMLRILTRITVNNKFLLNSLYSLFIAKFGDPFKR
jgi:hypothetical protein